MAAQFSSLSKAGFNLLLRRHIRMLKTKYALSALGLLVAMTMATDALAQGVFSVSSSIVPRARANGHTELAGGVTLARAASPVGDAGGTVTIDYSAAITNAVGDGTMNTIDVDICGTAGTGGDDGTVSLSGTSITVTVAATDCSPSDALDVSGVRLGIAGSGLSEVSASISASGDIRLGGNANDVPVIRQIVDELEDGDVKAEALTVIRHTGDPAPPDKNEGYFKLLIEENAVDSFDGAVLELDFAGIEPGMTITLDAWVSTKATLKALKPVNFVLVANDPDTQDVDESEDNNLTNDQLAFEGGDDKDSLEMTVTSTSTSVGVLMGLGNRFLNADGELVDDVTTQDLDESMIMGGSLSATAVDVVVIRGKISYDKGATSKTKVSFPLDDLDITASVDVGPVGTATLPRSGGERRTPRFASDPTTPITVITVTSDQTTLSLPYALSNGVFDTGIAISNMNTGDDQSGTITFQLYQTGEDMVEYETSDELAAGGTMAILLSEILTESGVETFQGYIMIVTDFTGADGLAYISDWAAFSATAALDCDKGCE
jgi:hypothetical protein